MVLTESPTIKKYKDTMTRCIRMYYPNMDNRDIDDALNYSINKRYKESKAHIDNSYTHKIDPDHKTLLAISDYIADREPIVTAFGTMFKRHGTVPNPLATVVQSFMDNRSAHKKMMFKYPRGSELFEKYNLLQSLDKIDCNGIYGVLGMYTALLYNINVATSITSQGRAAVSTMTLFFESFLADNVKFGSLNEVMEFIDHIVTERKERRFNSFEWIDNYYIPVEDVFAKVILECGYRWIPSDEEMEIIWQTLSNLTNEDRLRIYYKNNLYEFVSNSKIMNLVTGMIKKMTCPMFNSVEAPVEIQDDIKLFSDLLFEYVYYHYMYIDRIDRCDNMIKSVTMVSDTDSTIVSLDAWYRFIVEKVSGQELRIANYIKDPILFEEPDEDGDYSEMKWITKINFPPKKYDYNFATDEIVDMEHKSRPDILTPSDNVRYSIINIMGFVLDRLVNDYMERFCYNNHSMTPDRKCKIIAKNEYLFKRLMMTMVKKNYASIMEIQEGNMVPEKKQLDIKGIECLTKSTKSKKTREALQKILLEDILKAPVIDQLRFVKDMAIFEKQIVNSIRSGSKDYYKPVTIKAMNTYADPMRIQGIKASIAWNYIRPSELPAINLEERNAVTIAKIVLNKSNVDQIKDKYPEVYQNMLVALNREEFIKNKGIDAIAIPLEVDVPEWLYDFINYTELINTNIQGFPYESIGIMRMDKDNVNYTNIVKL